MKLTGQKEILATRPFKVEELTFERGDKTLAPYHRLVMPDWVNILPVTSDGKAVLVRQYRAGVMRETLEVPGGVVDPHEKDPMMAAVRELEEETGYTTQRVLPLGIFGPNPAIQQNRVHFFVGLAAYRNPQRQHFPDAEESLAVELVDAKELSGMVRTGQISHALAALCVMLAGKYVRIE